VTVVHDSATVLAVSPSQGADEHRDGEVSRDIMTAASTSQRHGGLRCKIDWLHVLTATAYRKCRASLCDVDKRRWS